MPRISEIQPFTTRYETGELRRAYIDLLRVLVVEEYRNEQHPELHTLLDMGSSRFAVCEGLEQTRDLWERVCREWTDERAIRTAREIAAVVKGVELAGH